MKLLITGAWQGAKERIAEIEKLGHSATFMQNEKDELPCSYEEVEGVVCNGLFLWHDIEKFTSLRYVQLTSAGFDRVPVEYIKTKGIVLRNARGVYGIPMAEFAIAGVLQLYKKSAWFYENKRAKTWSKNRELLELYGKTVCIVGAGNVGTECAKRFQAFGCKVIGVDLYPREDTAFERIFPLEKLDELLSSADVLVLTLPLTEESKDLMNEKRFGLLKKGCVFVNVSRGGVVDETALINALDETLLGAVVDVFKEEPLAKESPLWEKENVILTPHNSFVGDGNSARLFEVIIDGLTGVEK